MLVNIDKKILDKNIEFVSKFVDPINAFVPFRCIHFDVNNHHITLTASNGIMSVKKIIPVDENLVMVEKNGTFLVNANILKTIIKKINNKITLKIEENVLEISEAETKYELNLIKNEFPEIVFKISDQNFEIESATLEKAIRNVSFAAGDESKNAVLKCINLIASNNQLTLIASDSFRLGYEKIKLENNINFNILIDNKNLKTMISGNNPKNITVFIDINKIGIAYKNTIIQSTLVDLTYADISKIFPDSFSRQIIINKNELLELLNKVIFINQEKGNRIQFIFKQNELKLISEVSEIGKSEASTKNFTIKGDDIEIDFNYLFIKDAINVFDNGDINLLINQNGNIMMIVSDSNKNNKQLITPLRRY